MSVTSNAISSHANPMLLAQVAIPLEPPIGGVGEAPGVPLLGGGASAGEAVMAQMSLLQLSRDEPDGIREDFERALVDANKVGAREGGEFTLVVKAPLPFMQDSQKTVRVGKDGTLTLVEPSMSARPDCVLGRLGNVENYVGDGVSVNRFPTLARTVAPRVFENRGVPAQSGLGAVVATVQSVAAGHPQAVATLKKAFERERDRLLDANGAANPAREPTVKIELPTSQATTVVQAASFDARQVTQIASQVGASTLAAMSPPLQRYATARDGAYAQLKQLMAVAGDQPELRARAAKVENSLAHLDERSGRYASLAGAQAALGKFAGLPGLTDTDGTVLDRATVASKLRTVGAQVTTAAEDAGNKIEFLSDGIRGQQARYAAKVYDAQSGQVAQVLAGMDARIGQTRSAVQKSGSAPAQMQGLAGMTQARERYAAHADTWLSREYGRQLIDAGFTGQIRDGAGRPIDRKTLNQQSVQAMRGLRQDVVAFDQAAQSFQTGLASGTPGAKTAPVVTETKREPVRNSGTPPDDGSQKTPRNPQDPLPVPMRPDHGHPDPDRACLPEATQGHDGHAEKSPEDRRKEELYVAAILGSNVAFSAIGATIANQLVTHRLEAAAERKPTGIAGRPPESQEAEARLLAGASFESMDGLQLVVSDPVDTLKGKFNVLTDGFFNAGWTHGHDSQFLKDLGLPAEAPLQHLAGNYFNVATTTTVDAKTGETRGSIYLGMLSPRQDLPDGVFKSGRVHSTGLYSISYLQVTLSGGSPEQVAQAQEAVARSMSPLQARADQQLTTSTKSELKEWSTLRAATKDSGTFVSQASALDASKYAPQRARIAEEMRRAAQEVVVCEVSSLPGLQVKTQASNGAALLWQNPAEMRFDPTTGIRMHGDGRQIRDDGYQTDEAGCLSLSPKNGDPKDWAFAFASVAFTTPVGVGSTARASLGAYPLGEAHGLAGRATGLGALATIDGVAMAGKVVPALAEGRRAYSDGNLLYVETAKSSGRFGQPLLPGSSPMTLSQVTSKGAEPVTMELSGEMFSFSRSTRPVSQPRQADQLYLGRAAGVAFEAVMTANGSRQVKVETPLGEFYAEFKSMDALRDSVQQFVTSKTVNKPAKDRRPEGGSTQETPSINLLPKRGATTPTPWHPVVVPQGAPYGPQDLQQRI